MSYETKKVAVILSLLGYCIMGLWTNVSSPIHETYPFFSWKLFATIPSDQISMTTILIRSFDGVEYNPPLPFSKTGFLFKEIKQSPTEYTRVIGRLAGSIARDDTAEIRKSRGELEHIFRGLPARYELRRVTYNPVEYWRTGEYASSTLIADFDTASI